MVNLFVSFLLFTLLSNVFTDNKINFKLVKGSMLTISGTTNVKAKFKCECQENFYLGKYSMKASETNDTVTVDFKNATIVIPTKSFICENDGMTEDMHKALKADDHPTVTFNVVKAKIPKENIKGATIIADLTITGSTKRIILPLDVEQFDNNMYRFLVLKSY